MWSELRSWVNARWQEQVRWAAGNTSLSTSSEWWQPHQDPLSAFHSFLPLFLPSSNTWTANTSRETEANLGGFWEWEAILIASISYLHQAPDLEGEIGVNWGFSHPWSHQAQCSHFSLVLLLPPCGLCWSAGCFSFCFLLFHYSTVR